MAQVRHTLGYTALAAAFEVSLVFAAFLAGYALVTETELTELAEASRTLNKVSFSVFIPVYFAVVGYQLDLTRTFSLVMVVSVLAAACVVKLASGRWGQTRRLRWRDSVNLAWR